MAGTSQRLLGQVHWGTASISVTFLDLKKLNVVYISLETPKRLQRTSKTLLDYYWQAQSENREHDSGFRARFSAGFGANFPDFLGILEYKHALPETHVWRVLFWKVCPEFKTKSSGKSTLWTNTGQD